jgi:hypothetical protein
MIRSAVGRTADKKRPDGCPVDFDSPENHELRHEMRRGNHECHMRDFVQSVPISLSSGIFLHFVELRKEEETGLTMDQRYCRLL